MAAAGSVFGEEEIHLRDYYYVLMKRRRLILTFLLAALSLGIFFTFTERVIYQASATLLIEKDNPNVLDFKEVLTFDASSTDYYQTQYQMLKGAGLIRELLHEERLENDPYLEGLVRGRMRNFLRKQPWVAGILGKFLVPQSPEDVFAAHMLQIKPVRNSQLVSVIVLHPDNRRAASIANTLARLYIEQNLRNRYEVSTQATELISGQIGILKDKVAEADLKLQKYKEEHSLVSIPSLHEKDQFLQDAKLQLMKLQAREARMAKRYLPAHPKRIHLRSEIEGLDEKIKTEETRKIDIGGVAIQYDELEREAESARKVYRALLERLEQTHSEAKAQASNITVVDKAVPEPRPARPRPFLNLLMALVLGLMGGVFSAFFAEYLDPTIKIPDDVEKGLGLDLYGMIPKAGRINASSAQGEIFSKWEIVPNPAAEAIRALRTALVFKLRHMKGCHALLVTSPNPEEGKSTVALNLASAFQQNHFRALLIDADLRRPRLHKALGEGCERGLSDVLEGQCDIVSAVRRNVAGFGFDFLPAGSRLDHPTELLGTETAAKLFTALRQEYDMIIFDTSPYLAVADVAVLSEHADVGVIVARYHKTDKRHLKDVRRIFGEGNLKTFGIVMNLVEPRERHYYYHRYYYYGYGGDTPPK